MSRFRLALRVGGWLVLSLGLSSLPVGYGASPARDLSLFKNLADAGVFIKAAVAFIAVGVALLLASSLMSRFDPDDG